MPGSPPPSSTSPALSTLRLPSSTSLAVSGTGSPAEKALPSHGSLKLVGISSALQLTAAFAFVIRASFDYQADNTNQIVCGAYQLQSSNQMTSLTLSSLVTCCALL